MKGRRASIAWLVAGLSGLPGFPGLAGCAAPDGGGKNPDHMKGVAAASTAGAAAVSRGATLAFADGQPVRLDDLGGGLLEAAGGQVFSEWLLGRRLGERLAERGLSLSQGALATEEDILIRTLASDENEAHRLLRDLRERRGLGETRYRALLERNAGLRLLVADDVQIAEPAVRDAYAFAYGPRFEARLIVVGSAEEAADAVARLRGGASFTELASQVSTDPSRARGGLLAPISPADASYPAEVRRALERLAPGEVSPPVVVDNGFAILKLERKTEAAGIDFESVREEMQLRVRRQVERTLMERLARTLLDGRGLDILDPALQKSWDAQKPRWSGE